MHKTIRFIAPLIAASAAAAVAAAPIASAETHLECTYPSANSTQCETPGNVQLNSSPGVTATYPQYPYPYLYGGQVIDLGGLLGGGGNHNGGGGHGGGGHR